MTLTIELTPEQIASLGGVNDVAVAYKGVSTKERPVIDSTNEAAAQFKSLRNKKQEYFAVLTLDGANRLIANRIITIGTLTSSLVHPREVFADAITDRAASILVAHNHPSGSLKASFADHEVTQRLKDCGKLIGIELIDHLIINQDGHASII